MMTEIQALKSSQNLQHLPEWSFFIAKDTHCVLSTGTPWASIIHTQNHSEAACSGQPVFYRAQTHILP